MKTSMAYRLYRLFYNSNADKHELFGNRVHNPMHGNTTAYQPTSGALVRAMMFLGAVGTVAILGGVLG